MRDPGLQGMIRSKPVRTTITDYAMQDHPTVPPERGTLLNVSWRMQPDILSFISDAVCEGRLHAEASTSALKPAVISTVDIDHQGCTQSSEETAAAIGRLIQQLLGQSWADAAVVVASIKLDDIVVVSPFNMQVSLPKKRMPKSSRVGTFDKFQGQDALLVPASMATSFGGGQPSQMPGGGDQTVSPARASRTWVGGPTAAGPARAR